MALSDEAARSLMERARAAAERAYVPYSRFPVGAALLTTDEMVIDGCNIENASYGLTVCAERVAIFRAVAAGYRAVRAIAVTTPRSPGGTPCGACRQVLNEFGPDEGELIVILETGDGIEQLPLSALLPRSFGPRDLASAAPPADTP